MKNKKKIIITISVMLLITLTIIGLNNKEIKLDEVKLKNTLSYDSKNLSIMIYNNDKSGYEKYTGEGFPDRSQYVYNTTDSGCLNTNGDKINNALNYDAINRKVTVTTRETVHCYMYFSSGKTLTLEKGEGISKIYYKVNEDTEYSESNTTVSVALLPGNTYSYYAEASTGYTMGSCYDNNEHLCSGTMPNKNITIIIAPLPKYPLTINKGLGVTQICTKINGANDYTCETPVGNSITKEVNENSTYSYYGVASNNILDTCYDNNEHSCSGTMDNTEGKTYSIAPNMAKYVMSISNTTGSNGVITQTQESTVQTGSNATTDYRYIGASENVNNYVCLGSLKEDGSCIDEDHLYRIIGVMPTQETKIGGYENRIKLIKSTAYNDNDISTDGSYYWSGQKESGSDKYTSYTGAESNKNNWEESTLNRKVLNQTFYNSLEEKYQEMIGNSVWYLGGSNYESVSISGSYIAERSETKNGSNPTYAERKIGIMYISDYGYATSGGTTNRNTCLTTNLDGRVETDCKNNDWLLMSRQQWTINTYSTSYGNRAFFVSAWIASGLNCVFEFRHIVRPTFFLTPGIKVTSGTGSINSPYTLGN